MKSLEQQLKRDAKAFYKNPPHGFHESVMRKVENTVHSNGKVKSFETFKWFIPSGFVAAAIMLVVINMTPATKIDSTVAQTHLNLKSVQISKLNINDLSMNLESNLISHIQAEKKALQADFQYMKSKFTL
ncbi:MAG: hypothetical protein AB8B80_00835 [Marinicellaceae bacterium]